MEKITNKMREQLRAPIDPKGLKQHPTKSNMTVINPMFVIERLNDVFGVGQFNLKSEMIELSPYVQKTRTGQRDMFRGVVRVIFTVPAFGVHFETFGGSSNDDAGDALKGAVTDALTKCASWLEIGIDIYKGLKDQPQQKSNDNLPWMTEKYKDQVKTRIIKGDLEALDTARKHFKMKKDYFKELSQTRSEIEQQLNHQAEILNKE